MSSFRGKMLAKAYHITGNWQDAEDVVQDVALNMLGRKGIQNRKAYATTAVWQNAVQMGRKERRCPSVPIDSLAETPKALVYEADFGDYFGYKRLHEAVEQLAPKQQAVIRLVLEGYKESEIPGDRETVGSHYYFGLQNLKKIFAKKRRVRY